jgi:hypothetical protein
MIMGKAAKLSIDSTTKNQKLFVECTALLPVGKKPLQEATIQRVSYKVCIW